MSSMWEITQVKEIKDDGKGRFFFFEINSQERLLLKEQVLNVQISIQIYDICHVHNISLDVSPLCSMQSIQLYV